VGCHKPRYFLSGIDEPNGPDRGGGTNWRNNPAIDDVSAAEIGLCTLKNLVFRGVSAEFSDKPLGLLCGKSQVSKKSRL
jgi:hypothetical protein